MQYGLAHAEITPPSGTRFGGFWLERPESSIGAHDPLVAQAWVACDSSGAGVLVVSCDLQLISPPIVEEAKSLIHAATGIAPAHIMIHATHDHAAPGGDWAEAYVDRAGDYFAEPAVAQLVVDGIVQAAFTSWRDRFEGELLAAAGMVKGIGRSRTDPAGPAEAPAAALLLRDREGQVRGTVAWYACHPSILGPGNRLFSADFPAVVRRKFAVRYPGAISVYINGPAADISTRHTRRDQTVAEVERLGGELSAELLQLAAKAVPMKDGLVGAVCGTALLPLAPLPEHFSPLQRERHGRIKGQEVPCAVQRLRIGDLALVGVEAELNHEAGWEIMKRSPFGLTLPVAPANGSVGNVPSAWYRGEATARVVAEAERVLRCRL